jgi:hypothetical protein
VIEHPELARLNTIGAAAVGIEKPQGHAYYGHVADHRDRVADYAECTGRTGRNQHPPPRASVAFVHAEDHGRAVEVAS